MGKVFHNPFLTQQISVISGLLLYRYDKLRQDISEPSREMMFESVLVSTMTKQLHEIIEIIYMIKEVTLCTVIY